MNAYYQQFILMRHHSYYVNQWWNGHLFEQNLETTVLSDVDWRARFFEKTNMDVFINFPDPDHYYNPRLRRWVLNQTQWQDSNTSSLNELSSHLAMHRMNAIFETLNQNRELLDGVVFTHLMEGSFNDVNLWSLLNSFQH